MSRLFDDALSQYLEYAGAVVSAAPLTMSCWFRTDDLTVNQALISIGNGSGSSRWQLYFATSGAAVALAAVDSSATASNAIATGTVAANTWVHACGVIASASSRAAFRDGANKGTDATSITVSGVTRTTIGARYASGARGAYHSGRIAEVGIWSAALSDDEVLSLGKGVSPLLVRPGSLVEYPPLIGRLSPEPDLRGGANMTVVGATFADHCRIFYGDRA